MNGPLTKENIVIAKELSNLIELLLEQEEVHWMQRSRANWLQHGDQNTYFFFIILPELDARKTSSKNLEAMKLTGSKELQISSL
jgi:hypothetical protein